MPNLKTLLLAGLVGTALAADVACSDIQLAGRPCPCLSNYVCCDGVCELFACDGDKKASRGDDDDSVSSGPTTDLEISTLTQEKSSPKCITADPTTVFWMDEDGIVEAGSTVSKVNVRSRINPPVTKVETCSLLRSGDGLYVATAEGNAIQWLSVSTDGANPVVGERAFHFATFNDPVALAQDVTYIYALDGTSGQIRRLTKAEATEETQDGGGGAVTDAGPIPDGGTVASAGTLLGIGNTNAYSLVLSGDTLYWFDDTGLRRMAKTGGPIATLATIESSKTYHVAHDLIATADALYWIQTGVLTTVPIAGGVAHVLPYTPVQWLSSGSSSSTSSSTGGDDDDDDTTSTQKSSTQYEEDGSSLDSLALSDRGLILGHRTTVTLLGFQGGKELALFRYRKPETQSSSAGDKGMLSLLFDTSRFIWITGDGDWIRYRPLLETDPKLPQQ